MSRDSVGFWKRCWRTFFGADKSADAVADPQLAAGAEVIVLRPDVSPDAEGRPIAALAPHAIPASNAPAHAVIAPLELVSAEILTLPSDPGRHYMLSSRLGSVSALNQPKTRARKPAAPVCTTKPLRKRASAAAAPTLKPHRHYASPRVLRPERASAKIMARQSG